MCKIKNYIIKFIFLVIIFFGLGIHVLAKDSSYNEIYSEQMENLQVKEIENSLPKDAAKFLDDVGIKIENLPSLKKIDVKKFFHNASEIGKEKFKKVFSKITSIIGILILCSVINSICVNSNSKFFSNISKVFSTLAVCVYVIEPITKCIGLSKIVIESGSKFIIAISTVLSGIMVVSGREISAGAYRYIIIFMGEIILYIFSNFIIPIINMTLGMSIISSISSGHGLENICNMINKAIKQTVKFTSVIFVGLLTMQNVVTREMDNLKVHGAKFLIDSFVPIVGGALNDALSSVRGCLRLLKSGVGAFGIIAGGIIFLPILMEITLWISFFYVCEFFSGMFSDIRLAKTFKLTRDVMSTLLASILFVIVILISSVSVIIIMGGK